MWQTLPDSIKSLAFPKTFSKAVKNYLLDNKSQTVQNNLRRLGNTNRPGQRFQSRSDLEIGESTTLI